MKYPNTQAGSILSFLVVGAVLIIVTGTVFYVASHNMNDDKAAVDTPEVTLPGETDQSPTTSDENKAGQTDSDKAKDDDSQRATDNKSSADTSDSDTADVNELSQTGPADTAAQLIAIGGLSFAGAAFIRSRRKASL